MKSSSWLAPPSRKKSIALRPSQRRLADLDCIAALAELADVEGYTRPVVDDTLTFDIRDGRHPVVEQALARELKGPFIRNDCVLSRPIVRQNGSPRCAWTPSSLKIRPAVATWLTIPPGFDTGNTATSGWSPAPIWPANRHYLRQNALITLMAQMGSFVPAAHAHIGIVDRLFSRVGASDDIASGRSTFMVEMVEAAGILNAATERSFVILDEIGRGTSTFDGLSIAWATVEHLHDVNRCRALFATHYHELTTLSERLARSPTSRSTSRNGKTRSSSCTRCAPARQTAPTASMLPAWRACPMRLRAAPARS